MKIVALGGSALSTPALAQEIGKLHLLEPVTLVLAGRSERRLHAVARAARLLTGPSSCVIVRTAPIESNELEEMMLGAAVVLIQIRVGGFDARIADERLAEQFATPGDQEIGPTAVAGGWRAWPAIHKLLARIARATPRALVVILSSPVGLLVRLAMTAFPDLRVVGICELPWTTLLHVCQTLDVDVRAVEFDYYGINHFGSFYRLTLNGRDLLVDYKRRCCEKIDYPSFQSPDVGIPTPPTQQVLRAGTCGVSHSVTRRGARLAEISKYAFDAYGSGNESEIRHTLSLRPAPWYSAAIAPLVGLLAGLELPQVLFLSAGSRGPATKPSARDVIERPYAFQNRCLVPRESHNAPGPELRAAVSQLIHFERLAALAVISRSVPLLAHALSGHPWLAERDRALDLASSIHNGSIEYSS